MTKSLLLSAMLLLAAFGGASAARLIEDAPRVGYRAPKFESRNVAGAPVKLADFNGRVLLVNFWASWCAPCIAEFPDLAKLQASFPVTQFTVVALSQDTELEDVAAFLKEHPVNFPVVVDDEQQISRVYKVRGLPASYLIGANGVVVEIIMGPRNWSKPEWSAKIKNLIGKN